MTNKDNEHSIKELIHAFINQHDKLQLYGEQAIKEKWPEYVGPIFAKCTECLSLHNGILRVRVPHAALRFEITTHKSMIIARINADYQLPIVKNILFL